MNDASHGYVKGEPLRYIAGHRERLQRKRRPVLERIWARTVKASDSGCWVWRGKPNPRGYGVVNVPQEVGRGAPRLVHRVVYEALVGPVSEGLTIDHLCANTLCVNPAHLEPVTRSENTRRQWRDGRANAGVRQREKTHCRHGHPYSPENTYVKPNGERVCKTCRRASWTRENRKRASRAHEGNP